MKTRGFVFFGVPVCLLTACRRWLPPAYAQTDGPDLSVNFGLGSGGLPDLVPLAAYWHFDEGTGTTAADSTGNGDHGTLVNGPRWVRGQFSNALAVSRFGKRLPYDRTLRQHYEAVTKQSSK